VKIKELVLGLKGTGAFALPLDAVTETFAVMGIRGSGKTSLAKVMAEHSNHWHPLVGSPPSLNSKTMATICPRLFPVNYRLATI